MFSEDLDAFLDADEHAIEASFTPSGGSASTVKVLFDRAYAEQFGVAGTNPFATGKASDFPAATTEGGTLVISGTTYTIRVRQPVDDGAFVMLQLTV